MSQVITLTTDFGLTDHYVGAMKGVIVGINPDSFIIDITHSIPKYDITKAAFVIRNFYKYFPKDSVHVVVVDPGVGGERKPVVVESEYGIFVGPDNGVFTFILDEGCNVYEISNQELMLDNVSSTFHGRDIFAPLAAHLSLGVNINDVGKKIEAPIRIDIKEPEILNHEIRGEVICVDSFGNLITNIRADMIGGMSQIQIDEYTIDTVASSYNEQASGELLAIIGSSGFLEISVNQGSASGIIRDHKVTIKKVV